MNDLLAGLQHGLVGHDFRLIVALVVRVVAIAHGHAAGLEGRTGRAAAVEPGEELLGLLVARRSHLLVELLLAHTVLLLEHLLELAQVLHDAAALLGGEQVLGAGAPGELVELLLLDSGQQLALECVHVEAVLEVAAGRGVAEVGDGAGSQEAAGGVPVQAAAAVVAQLGGQHRVALNVVQVEHARVRGEVRQGDDAAGGGPDHLAALDAGLGEQQGELVAGRGGGSADLALGGGGRDLAHGVEGDAGGASLAVHDGDAVSGGLPGDVEDGLVQLELLHGHVSLLVLLVLQAEEHEHVALLLALVLGHVHAQVVALVLPHHAAVGHVEQLAGAHVLAARQADDADQSGVVAHGGRPVGDHVGLGAAADHAVSRLLGAARLLGRSDGRLHLELHVQGVLQVEGSDLGVSAHVPHDDGLLGVELRVEGVAVGDQVLLARGEGQLLHLGVHVLAQRSEFTAAPQLDAGGVEGGEVSALGGPGHVTLAPHLAALLLSLTAIHEVGVLASVVGPVNFGLVAISGDELVSARLVGQPRGGIGSVVIGGRGGLHIFLGDLGIVVQVGVQTDLEDVLLINGKTLSKFDCLCGFLGTAEFDESKSVCRFGLLVERHVNIGIGDSRVRSVNLQQHREKLGDLLSANSRQVVDNNGGGKVGLEYGHSALIPLLPMY
eukprot:Colp12_sorted_trinity150504_noHs@3220